MDNRQQRRLAAKARAQEFQSHMNAASNAMRDGDVVAAEREYQAALVVDPLAAEPHHLLAHIAYGQGRLQNAGDHILEAATRDDGNLEIHADCGAIMNMLGRGAEAEAACRHVLQHKPSHAEACNNLSVAIDIQGRWAEALVVCEEALSLRPDYADALINKGSLLVKLEQPVAAIEALAEAVHLAPENPLARVNLATAMRKVGEHDAALEQCQLALEIKPDYPEAQGVVGDIMAAAGDFETALKAYDAALGLRPGFMAVRLNRAAALYKLSRLDDAAEAYRSVLVDFESSADAHAGLGAVYLASGETERSIEAYRTAVDLNPRHGSAWAALSAVPGGAFSDHDIQAIKVLCEDETASQEFRIAGHFALAENLDRSRDFDAAFEHFNIGNEARKALLAERDQVFDFDALMEGAHSTIAAFQQDVGEGEGASDDERPVFVLGMPRSGTTLVQQILAAHPDGAGAGEALSIAALSDGLGPAEMAGHALDRLAAVEPDAERIVDKTPFHFHHVGLIRHLFPSARIIHCRRDPMDTGLSCYMQNFADDYPWSCNLRHIGLYTRVYETLMGHWRTILGDKLVEVHYEDLVSDPELQVRQLLDQVGLDWNPACLEHHKSHQPVFSASSWQVRQPLYTSSKGRAENYAAHLEPLRDALSERQP